jgi:uncharacterized RDD family membrane protein YckC
MSTTLSFLNDSEKQRDELRADRELDRRWQLRWQPVIASVVALAFLSVLYGFRSTLLPSTETVGNSFDLARAGRILLGLAKLTPLTALAAAIYYLGGRVAERTYKRMARPKVIAALRDPVKSNTLSGSPRAEVAKLPYASMRMRTLAFVIDLPVAAILLFLGFCLAAIPGSALDIKWEKGAPFLILAGWIVVTVLYHAFVVGSKMRGTVGMFACRLCVADLDGGRIGRLRAGWREVLKWVTLPVYWPLVYIAALWSFKQAPFVRRRQWLPDIMSKTVVIKRARKTNERTGRLVPVVRG